MRLEFEVVSKECSIQKGTLARLVSTVDCNGRAINDGQYYGYGPLAQVDIDAKDANLLDNFNIGDIVELELAICSVDKKKGK